MTRPDLIDDDPATEGLLRQVFAADAAEAPRPDLRGLSDSAVRHGRSQRRRAAVAGAALSVVLVLAGVAVVDGVTGQRQAEPPTSSTSPTPAPTPSVEAGSSMLMFRGAEVPVPAAMLDPNAVRCGTPVKDAAYVVDASVPLEACLVMHPQDGLTTVVLQPIEDVPEGERNPGGRTLDDGRYQVSSALPLADVWFTVTSPDKARATRLFEGVRVSDSVNGCPLHQEPAPSRPTGEGRISVELRSGDIGRVCGYRNGWLTGAKVLSHQQAVTLADLVAAGPSDAMLDCAVGVESPGGWWLELGASRVWVGGGCPPVVAYSGGTSLLTDALVSQLWSLAPGPASLPGVVSSKG